MNSLAAIGADFFSKKLVVDGENITLQITDCGGQDQFAEISNIFTKGAHGALLAYDTTRRDSLDSLDKWINKLEDINIPKVLVSTKNDVEDLREVLDEEGLEIAKKYNIPYYIPTSNVFCTVGASVACSSSNSTLPIPKGWA